MLPGRKVVLGVVMLLGARVEARRMDRYGNFRQLAQHEREGRDFRIQVVDRHAPISVIAMHGGHIDEGTDRIAERLAADDLNLYVFSGIKARDNWSLHVTAAHFDEPRAVALAQRSDICLAVHAHVNDEARLCLGGTSARLRDAMQAKLSALPFRVLTECKSLEGTAPSNLVNQCRVGGVQLEFSSALREQLFADPGLMKRTLDAIRAAALR